MQRDDREVEWNAHAYHQLGEPQHGWGQKVLDRFIARLRGDEVVLDAGCGTGRVTAELLERAAGVSVIALDQSSNMLEVAAQFLVPRFGARVGFLCADLATLELERPVDAVFSTATFHWVTDHPRLFANLWRALVPGGIVVAQCGGGPNLARLVARIEALMRQPPFARWLAEMPPPWEFADEVTTARRLAEVGFVDVETRLTPAPTVLQDARVYAEFVSNIVVRHHLARLNDRELRDQFMAALVEQAANDEPAWSLDYVRLDLTGRRAA